MHWQKQVQRPLDVLAKFCERLATDIPMEKAVRAQSMPSRHNPLERRHVLREVLSIDEEGCPHVKRSKKLQRLVQVTLHMWPVAGRQPPGTQLRCSEDLIIAVDREGVHECVRKQTSGQKQAV